jgi:protein TonB
MNPAELQTTVPASPLKSELARYCLPSASRDSSRKLAWTNSICLLFILVGIFGAQQPVLTLRAVKPLDETVPVVIEPLTPPPAPPQETQPETTDQDRSETPQIVAVTLDSPSVNFSVPTIGNVLVPQAMASAPPVAPLKQLSVVNNLPTTVSSTGQGGDRPDPQYPQNALRMGLQGSVALSITVNEEGRITAIEVKQSSGFKVLDNSALNWVRQHWVIPPANGSKLYEATITYRLSK